MGTKSERERLRRRRELRQRDRRVSSALAEVRSHQQRIDGLAKRSEGSPAAQGPLLYSLVQERKVLAEANKSLATVTPSNSDQNPLPELVAGAKPGKDIDIWGSGNGNWSLQDATNMLIAGYTLRTVIHRTGWGAFHFLDLIDYLDDDPVAQAELRRVSQQLDEQRVSRRD